MTTSNTSEIEKANPLDLQTASKGKVETETPSSTTLKNISTGEVKQVLLALIKENKAEFKQFLAELLTYIDSPLVQKEKEPLTSPETIKKEPLPSDDMPIWQANPDLNPPVLGDEDGLSKDFWDALHATQEAFKDITDEEWDDILE